MGVDRARAKQRSTRATEPPPRTEDGGTPAAFTRLRELMEREEGVDPATPESSRRRFGATALKTGGKIFAMAVQGTLVLKLPASRVDALVAAGLGARFDPGHGRKMKEWVALTGAEEGWLPLAREARAFVSSEAE